MEMEVADIILSRERSFSSWLVRFAIGSEWSHASIYIGDGEYVSAVPFDGVCIKDLSNLSDYSVYRVKEINDDIRDGVMNFLWSKIGNKYDFLQIILLSYRLITDSLSKYDGDPCPDKFVCSELVAEAFASQGIMFGKIIDNVLPGHLSNSDIVFKVNQT